MASISAITAPARYSCSASEPTIASTAITSTPGSLRIAPRTTEIVIGTAPINVVSPHATFAASGCPETRNAAPAVMPRIDAINQSRSRSVPLRSITSAAARRGDGP